jgi:diphthamide synthase subunit DPH2
MIFISKTILKKQLRKEKQKMKKILMNKKIITIIGTVIALMILVICGTGCNRQIIDTKYNYKTAICRYDGYSFNLKIKKWRDYEGEQIQIIDETGHTYLISTNNCFLRDF